MAVAALVSPSPLASPPVCIILQEFGGEQVTLHASGAVLQKMPYFTTRLSDRWKEQRESMDLRLPEGCTAAALTVLLERLHFPTGEWAGLNLDMVLQIVQLAGMLLIEDAVLLAELNQLLRNALRTRDDIDTLKLFSRRIEAPGCIAEVAAGFERAQAMSILSSSEQLELLQHAFASGDGSSFEMLERVMRKCHADGSAAIAASAEVFANALKKGAAPNKDARKDAGYLTYYQSFGSYQNRGWQEKPCDGLSLGLSLVSRFVFAYPEHFSTLVPLMFPKCGRVLDSERSQVQRVFQTQLKNMLDQLFTEDSWEFPCDDFKTLFSTLSNNDHVAQLCGFASFANFVQRATVEVKVVACDMLCEAKASVAASIVTSQILDALPDPSRQKLCRILVSHIGLLSASVKAKVLDEVRSGMGLGAADEPFAFQPKRRRRQ